MSELRRVTITKPGAEKYVSIDVEPLSEIPPNGAKVQISYIGSCYTKYEAESNVENVGRTSMFSRGSDNSHRTSFDMAQTYPGYLETSFYSGFELSGVLLDFGKDVDIENCGLEKDSRVVILPDEKFTNVCVEFFMVDDVSLLVPVPRTILLSIACQMPGCGLYAALASARIARDLAVMEAKKEKVNVLVLGSGTVSLWIVKMLFCRMGEKENIKFYMASQNENGLRRCQDEFPSVETIKWDNSELLDEEHYKQIVEEKCGDLVDVVVNFGTTEITIRRAFACLHEGGRLYINEEATKFLLGKFVNRAYKEKKGIESIALGNKNHLVELLDLVQSNKVIPPAVEKYPLDEGHQVYERLATNEILGPAVLKLNIIDD